MKVDSLLAISPIDGRYIKKTASLQPYFSEFGLIRYRLIVEIEYLIAVLEFLKKPLKEKEKRALRKLYENFSVTDARQVKKIEQKTRHDVKALEYFIKKRLPNSLQPYKEMVHFGLTSFDINDNAYSLILKDAINDLYIPRIAQLISKLRLLAKEYRSIAMLARTHGQPASPTTVGKELANFEVRLQNRIQKLKNIRLPGKLTGATGNFNALHVTYPEKNWVKFSFNFITGLGLSPRLVTTQILPREEIADLLNTIITVNNVLLDLNRDMWLYISYDYFKLRVKKGQVGSSTMPHKVNPINFENSEGNLELANALLSMIANKIQISRLQRDLSDSTVMRNIGVGFAHSVIAYKSCLNGLESIDLNQERIQTDLDSNWSILGEAVQTMLRKEGRVGAYERIAEKLQGIKLSRKDWTVFVDLLDLSDETRKKLLALSPENYLGLAEHLTTL